MKYAQHEKDTAIAQLREWLKPGDTVNCISRHTSRSGMSRSISLFAVIDGEMREISYTASRAMGESIDQKHGGVRIGGCGMDMGFALVYELSSALFPDGFGCVGKGVNNSGIYCPSNDHSNGDRDYTPHSAKMFANGLWNSGHVHWHRSGGYALRHRWM